MTKHFATRIITDVLVILVSVVMITIAATSLGEPIRSGIAASIPIPFDLAMGRTLAIAEPSTPKVAQAQPKCRLPAACSSRLTNSIQTVGGATGVAGVFAASG
jgi:hypothetical protein